MCLIGLLLPYKHKKKSRRHRSKSSSRHRSSERERCSRLGKDQTKDPAQVTEDALARLCLSLEQSLMEEQRRWRDQDRLDLLERQRLGLEPEREREPSEEAPPYSFRDERARPPSPEPRHQTGVADSPECRNRDSVGGSSTYCCLSCVCARCGFANVKCPTVPELDDTRVGVFTERAAETRRRRA